MAATPGTCRTFILILLMICNEFLCEILYVTKAIKTFALRKNVTLPHLVVLHAKFRGRLKIESSPLLFLFYELAVDCFANSEITKILV
jgi:hypothetical protein